MPNKKKITFDEYVEEVPIEKKHIANREQYTAGYLLLVHPETIDEDDYDQSNYKGTITVHITPSKPGIVTAELVTEDKTVSVNVALSEIEYKFVNLRNQGNHDPSSLKRFLELAQRDKGVGDPLERLTDQITNKILSTLEEKNQSKKTSNAAEIKTPEPTKPSPIIHKSSDAMEKSKLRDQLNEDFEFPNDTERMTRVVANIMKILSKPNYATILENPIIKENLIKLKDKITDALIKESKTTSKNKEAQNNILQFIECANNKDHPLGIIYHTSRGIGQMFKSASKESGNLQRLDKIKNEIVETLPKNQAKSSPKK